jgi:hypothetical protein
MSLFDDIVGNEIDEIINDVVPEKESENDGPWDTGIGGNVWTTDAKNANDIWTTGETPKGQVWNSGRDKNDPIGTVGPMSMDDDEGFDESPPPPEIDPLDPPDIVDGGSGIFDDIF